MHDKVIILLEEYKTIKNEQSKRIAIRDNLIYVNFASIAIVISTYFSTKSPVWILLFIPFVNFILGWTYIMNDIKISAIGNYIRHEITPLLKKQFKTKESFLDWETYCRSYKLRKIVKVCQLITHLFIFVFPGGIAISYYFVMNDSIMLIYTIIAIILSLCMLILMLFFIITMDYKIA